MRKRLCMLGLLLLLVACNEEVIVNEEETKEKKDTSFTKVFNQEEKDVAKKVQSKDKGEKKVIKDKIQKELTTEEAAEVVRDNLRQIEDALPNYSELPPDEGDAMFQTIADIRDDNYKENEEAISLINEVKEDLKDYFTENSLERMAIRYLVDAHSSMDKDFLIARDIEARYTIEKQEDNTFTFSFIRLVDEEGTRSAGTFTVQYAYENGKWRMVDYNFLSTDEQSLQLTFDDLDFYYTRLREMTANDDYAQNYDYEPIEIMEIGYDDYLVFELDGVMKGRNIHTSEIFMP